MMLRVVRVHPFISRSGNAGSGLQMGCKRRTSGGTTLTVSINFRLSSRAVLSLMSLLATQALIWSRSRWSFFICVLRSVSSFSFCVWLVEFCILS